MDPTSRIPMDAELWPVNWRHAPSGLTFTPPSIRLPIHPCPTRARPMGRTRVGPRGTDASRGDTMGHRVTGPIPRISGSEHLKPDLLAVGRRCPGVAGRPQAPGHAPGAWLPPIARELRTTTDGLQAAIQNCVAQTHDRVYALSRAHLKQEAAR